MYEKIVTLKYKVIEVDVSIEYSDEESYFDYFFYNPVNGHWCDWITDAYSGWREGDVEEHIQWLELIRLLNNWPYSLSYTLTDLLAIAVDCEKDILRLYEDYSYKFE